MLNAQVVSYLVPVYRFVQIITGGSRILDWGIRARGWGGCSPLLLGRSRYFSEKLNFSGTSQQPKLLKNILY